MNNWVKRIYIENKYEMTEQEADNMTNEPIDSTEMENQEELTTEKTETVELSAEETLKAQLEAVNDKYIRLLAEFDNFKRRTAKERMDLYKVANEDSLKSMITVLDDFDRAQKSVETAVDMEAVKEGLKLVHHKLKSTVTAQGLKEMENTIGSAFNTDLHEAVTNIPAPTEDLKGKVIDELEKGYTLNDKVIRFAKVVVGA